MTYATIRESLAKAGEALRTRFIQGEPVVELVRARAAHIDEVLVSYDGQVGTHLEPGSHIVINRKPWELRLVRLGKDGFFERVRDKLQWGDLSDRENRRRSDQPVR